MTTESRAEAADLSRAARALTAGDLIVYPTETLYGLGAEALSSEAIGRLVELKGRDARKGMSALVSGSSMARSLAEDENLPTGATKLMAELWPGPITIVVRAKTSLPSALIGPNGGVGLRCSPDRTADALLGVFGGPITSTSANPSEKPAANSVEEARAYFGDRVACYLDGGDRGGGVGSTVVEFLGERAILRRLGALSVERIASIFPVDS